MPMCRWVAPLVAGVFLFAAGTGASAQDIFVTPVPGAPFTGTIRVERTLGVQGGPAAVLQTVRGIGRDSQGRIYTESRALVPQGTNVLPILTRVLIYDPQTRTSTVIDPRRRTYRSFVVRRPPATEPPNALYASPDSPPLSPYTREEELGTRQMMSLSVHGVREIQTIPDPSGNGQNITVTDDYWYSDALHMNLALRHSDPRTGTVTMVVTDLSLAEPDPSRFQVPDGYTDMAHAPAAPPNQPAQPSPAPQP